MYQFLDKYWEEIDSNEKRQDLDDLGGLLGSMDPTLWSDGMPVDKGLVADWEEISQKKDYMTEIESYSLMIQFLEKQLDWLKLEVLVTELKTSLSLKDNNWKLWLSILKYNSDFKEPH